MKKFSHRQKLFMILAVALVAVLLQYAFKQALAAQILVTIVGAGIALSMLIEMIHTLKNGCYGVDLLAIIAVVSTVFFRISTKDLKEIFLYTRANAKEYTQPTVADSVGVTTQP